MPPRFVFTSANNELTTSATSASYTTPEDSVNVSFTWSGSLPTGSFANSGFPNHLFVVAPSGITLTAATPTTQDVAGYEAYGIMENAYLDNSIAANQGFDALLASFFQAEPRITYNGTLNVHPTKNGSKSVAVNTTLTMAVRKSGSTTSSWSPIGDYVHLHVLAAAPPLGAFPPSVASTDKTILGKVSDIDWTRLRSLSLSFTETPSVLYSYLPQDTADMYLPNRAGAYRALNQHRYTNPAVTTGYSRDYSPTIGKAMLALHSSSISTTDRNNLAYRLVGWGIQLYGASVRYGANALQGGAGQGGGQHGPLFIAGLLLNNSAMIADAAAQTASPMVGGFTISEGLVGKPAPGKSGVAAQTYFTEQIGMPWIQPDEVSSAWDARYIEAFTPNMVWELLGVVALQQGAGASSGLTAYLNGESIGGTGRRASSIGYMDRVKVNNFNLGGGYPGSEWRTTYDTIQAAVGWTKWSGRPEQIPFDDSAETSRWFSDGPSNGQIQWDFSSLDGDGNGTISSTDIRLSLDGAQYVEFAGVGDTSNTGTAGITLATGMPYYASGRRVNGAGAGAWSANYPWTGSTPRNRITTPGTKSGTITQTHSAKIMSKAYPLWNQTLGNWKETPASPTSDDVVLLRAGLGLWTGNFTPETSFAFQWEQSDTGSAPWTDISGATSAEWAGDAALEGKFIRCEITPSGGSAVYTNTIEMPATASLPAGTLIDTNFNPGFTYDYSAEWAGITEDDADAQLQSGGDFVNVDAEGNDVPLDGLNPGALVAVKIGNFPSITMPISRAATNGVTYRVQAQVVTHWTDTITPGFNGALGFDVLGSDFAAISLNPDPNTTRVLLDIDQTCVASGTSLSIILSNNSSTGGGSGGDACLTYLKISEV